MSYVTRRTTMYEYGLNRTVAPVEEPVTLDEAKDHCRIHHSDSDTTFESLITAATRSIEQWTGRQFVTATWAQTLAEFPDCHEDYTITLMKSPLIAVSSIQYVDAAGDSQTLATTEYQVSTKRQLGRVRPAYSKSWPVIRNQMDAVTVTFTAGYGGASAVPAEAKAAIKMLVAHWYDNPEPVVASGAIPKELPFGVWNLIDLLKPGKA